jgi:5-methylcytosine-specific restriction endonuclease McrA
MPINKCPVCGKDYFIPEYYSKRGRCKTCSRECSLVLRRKTIVCLNCGKEKTVAKSYGANYFCSKKCAGEYIRNTSHISNWQRDIIAKKVKDRDKKCLICGSTEKLEAHHIVSESVAPELTTNTGNIITLCESCHKKTKTYGSQVIKKKKIWVQSKEVTFSGITKGSGKIISVTLKPITFDDVYLFVKNHSGKVLVSMENKK